VSAVLTSAPAPLTRPCCDPTIARAFCRRQDPIHIPTKITSRRDTVVVLSISRRAGRSRLTSTGPVLPAFWYTRNRHPCYCHGV